MSVYVRCEARKEAPVPKSRENVLLGQTGLQQKKELCLVKNGSNMYPGDDGVKELVIICDHVHFRIELKDSRLPLVS